MKTILAYGFLLATAALCGCSVGAGITFSKDGGTAQETDGGVYYRDGGFVYEDGGVVYEDGGVAFEDGGVVYEDGGLVYEDGGAIYRDGGIGPKMDGGVFYRDGGVVYEDGGVLYQDGGFYYQDGGVFSRDGGVVDQDGGFYYQDGGVIYRDGGVIYEDGGFYYQDGGVIYRDGGFLNQDGGEFDAGSEVWAQLSPAVSPVVRQDAAMAYDSKRGVTVLFGGLGGSASANTWFPLNDTWEWDGTNWTEITPVTSPPKRALAAMAYDSTREVTVLFGGYSGTNETDLGDTWEWDGSNWTERTPTTHPSAREYPGIAFDSVHNMTVLFGGHIFASTMLGDTWTWDGTIWTQLSPAGSPSPRWQVAMDFDPTIGVTTLFGGCPINGAYCPAGGFVNDTWEWNGATWAEMTPLHSPTPRSGARMVYDSADDDSVLFGGNNKTADFTGTWTWDGTDWINLSLTLVPSERQGFSMIYDSARQQAVLFGGSNTTDDLNDTWVYGLAP